MELKRRVESGDLVADVFVCDMMDRTTRKSILDAHEDIGRIKNCGLLFADANTGDVKDFEDPTTQLTTSIGLYTNEQEVKKTADRVTSGTEEKFRNRTLGWQGQAPFGFNHIKQIDAPSYLEPNGDIGLVKEMFSQLLRHRKLQPLVSLLERGKRYKTDGGSASSTSVRQLLRNAIYTGRRTIGVRVVGKYTSLKGANGGVAHRKLKKANSSGNVNPLTNSALTWDNYVEAAVSLGDYNDVHEILDHNKENFERKPASAGHKYSSLLKCGTCGGSLVGQPIDRAEGTVEIDYVCSASTKIGKKCRQAKPYRKAVSESVLDNELEISIALMFSKGSIYEKLINHLIESYLQMLCSEKVRQATISV